MDADLIMQQKQENGPADTTADNEIIRRVIGGEKELYTLIVRKYNQRLYRVGLSIINDEAAIEDVMQTTYIKAYENLDKFRFESAFSTWITRILVNESLMYLKRKEQGTHKRTTIISFEMRQPSLELQTPLMKVINNELKIILELSIKNLPEKYRTVFVMRELENMSVAETMSCLGLSEANVKVRLNRAKLMLRDKLKTYIGDEGLLQFYQPRCNKVVRFVMDQITKD
jgi:RNA polymerase sigma factor (sigma-70 family)